MDALENDNKESTITLQDFPSICRICCSIQNDMILFEDYLLDLFQTTCNIEVRFICNGCIKELEDISLFIGILKNNDASVDTNIKLKKEVADYADSIESGTSLESAETTHGNEEDMCLQGSQSCGICLSQASNSTLFEKKSPLMKVFQNITNSDVMAESNSKKNRLCDKCVNQLEKITSFISLLISNSQKLDNTIGRNETMKTEYYSNTIHFETTCHKLKLESEVKSEIIDIKEEIIDEALAISTERKYTNELKIHSETIPGEAPFENFLIKETLGEESQLPHLLLNIDRVTDQTTQSAKNPFECLQTHMLTDTENNVFELGTCDKSFLRKCHVKRHLFTGPDKRPINCGVSDLKHCMHIHTGERPFKCDSCEKSFTKKSNLKRHFLVHAEEEKPFKCDSCEKGFSQESYLQRHQLVHTGERPFKCDSCEKSYNRKCDLKHHSRIHTGEKAFNCESCEKSFSRKSHLKQHLPIHAEEKPFKCDSCEKGFSQKSSLQHHLFIHTGEKPFECDSCKKSFAKKSHLIRHVLLHTRKKSFKCDCCEKSFTLKLSLKQHMHVHSGKMSFICDRCEKSFTQKSHLKRHLLIHSREKPFV